MSLIIAGFPGMGKSYLFNENKEYYSDSDSSKFDKKDFPKNYIEHIKKLIGKKQLILVSSHIEVRNALLQAGLPFIYVLPTLDRLEEFCINYKKRGSSKEFIEKVRKNWEQWLMISGYNTEYPVYFCKHGYLKDNLEGIIKEYNKFYNEQVNRMINWQV